MSGRVVLLTRPEPQSRALAATLAQDGFHPLIWPLLRIAPRGPAPALEDFQAVIVSSANAARRLPPTALPVLCVGAATAQAAREAGAEQVFSADGDAAALAALAARLLSPGAGPVLFARGEEVAGDPGAALTARGFDLRERVVYAARPARAAPKPVAAALAAGAVDVAAFYSPRSAAAFAARAAPWRRGLAATEALAISAAAAEPLAGLGFGGLRVAQAPNGAAMLAALRAGSQGAGAAT